MRPQRRVKGDVLSDEPLREPVARQNVEFAIPLCRAGRVDTRDFELQSVHEDQFEPLIDRSDLAAVTSIGRAKSRRRLCKAGGRERSHGGVEKFCTT